MRANAIRCRLDRAGKRSAYASSSTPAAFAVNETRW